MDKSALLSRREIRAAKLSVRVKSESKVASIRSGLN